MIHFYVTRSYLALSGRIGNAVAWCFNGFRIASRLLHSLFIANIYMSKWRSWGRVGSNGSSIGFPVFDAIVRSWLWSTSTENYPLDYFSKISVAELLTPQTVVVDSPLGAPDQEDGTLLFYFTRIPTYTIPRLLATII